MLGTQLRELDDLNEFETFVQLSFETTDLQYRQSIRVTTQGIYEGLTRNKFTGEWFFLLRNESGHIRFIPTLSIVAFIRLGNH